MTARALLGLFDSVYVLALTAWVGSILYFSFGVAPVVFKALNPQAAAQFLRALFPRYYAWGATAGAIALPAFVGGALSFPEYRGPLVGVQAFAILLCILIMLYAGNSLTPAINTARDAGPPGAALFERLHRRSVHLNTLVLIVGCLLLIRFATRPAPRTEGILGRLTSVPAANPAGRNEAPGLNPKLLETAENHQHEANSVSDIVKSNTP